MINKIIRALLGIESVRSFRLFGNSVIVVKVHNARFEDLHRIQDNLQRIFPENKCIVLDEHIKMEFENEN